MLGILPGASTKQQLRTPVDQMKLYLACVTILCGAAGSVDCLRSCVVAPLARKVAPLAVLKLREVLAKLNSNAECPLRFCEC